MRYGEGFMHLYSFYYLYVFPDNKDVNTEKYYTLLSLELLQSIASTVGEGQSLVP